MSFPTSDPSLILYIPFFEGTSTAVKDVSQSDKSCTAVGIGWEKLSNGKYATIYSDSGDKCPVPVSGSGDPIYDAFDDQPFTINLWVKWNGSTGTQRYVADWYSNRVYIGMTGTTGSLLQFSTGASATGKCTATTSLVSGTWYMITATSDGSSATAFYINAVEEDTGTPQTITPVSPYTLVIGGHHTNGAHRWEGSIADVMVFNKVLTAEEVTDIYRRTYRE